MTTIKTRPILMSAPLVRETLADLKTQTRRLTPIKRLEIKSLTNDMVCWSIGFSPPVNGVLSSHSGGKFSFLQASSIIAANYCKYGRPGDRLWVRENGWERPERTPKMMREGADTWPPYEYDADNCDYAQLKAWGWKRRPSIHMPRWASRITLEITAVRVERLQDISEADCIAEGARGGHGAIKGYAYNATPLEHFRWIWITLNGQASWDANPWVWVLEFRRLK